MGVAGVIRHRKVRQARHYHGGAETCDQQTYVKGICFFRSFEFNQNHWISYIYFGTLYPFSPLDANTNASDRISNFVCYSSSPHKSQSAQSSGSYEFQNESTTCSETFSDNSFYLADNGYSPVDDVHSEHPSKRLCMQNTPLEFATSSHQKRTSTFKNRKSTIADGIRFKIDQILYNVLFKKNSIPGGTPAPWGAAAGAPGGKGMW